MYVYLLLCIKLGLDRCLCVGVGVCTCNTTKQIEINMYSPISSPHSPRFDILFLLLLLSPSPSPSLSVGGYGVRIFSLRFVLIMHNLNDMNELQIFMVKCEQDKLINRSTQA